MHRSLLLLIVTVPVVAAPGVKETGKDPVLYFPVKEGTKWVTETRLPGETVEATHTVRQARTRDGTHTVTVDTVAGGRTQTAVYEVSAAGVVLLPAPGGKRPSGRSRSSSSRPGPTTPGSSSRRGPGPGSR